jgi:UDP-N-acetylglucosamine 2-epimerase (non-hydrolysing)
MNVRRPDVCFDTEIGGAGGAGRQIGKILENAEALFSRERPDRVLLLGDTNSALCAIIAKRMGIPVFHMEAGNRCYDDRVPEEVNRRIIDHCSDILMPYTQRSRENLLREGIPGQRVFVTGNPIAEVITAYDAQIGASDVLARLRLSQKKYFLATLHRAENVDVLVRLEAFLDCFARLAANYDMPVIVSTHPRTRDRIRAASALKIGSGVRLAEPFGFFDFITLEKSAFCVLSDSGTVQEECAIFGRPNVTLRDVTERPETVECGSNYISGTGMESILRGVALATAHEGNWQVPPEYTVRNVSDTVLRLVTGYRHEFNA